MIVNARNNGNSLSKKIEKYCNPLGALIGGVFGISIVFGLLKLGLLVKDWLQ